MRKRRTYYHGISELVQPHADQGSSEKPLTVVPDAGLIVEEGRIVAAGPRAMVENAPEFTGADPVDLGERAIIPGF
ncbi:MAG: hypothetical protein AAF658_10405, partial [Myxococcota bacterium]